MRFFRWLAELLSHKPEQVSINPIPAPAQGTPKSAKRTTGIRNRNPLNVKANSPTMWQGQVAKDNRDHAIFDDEVYGLRAAIVLLRTYWQKYHLRTIGAILSRWAPTSDTIGSLPGAPPNSPRDYAEFVQERTGIEPNSPLQLFNENGTIHNTRQLHAIVSAMAEYENYAGYTFSRIHFDRAATMV